MDLKSAVGVVISSAIFAFVIAFPIIWLLYKFNITRRMNVDFSSLIEKRNLKIGVPIMGGLIIVITVFVFNILFNPARGNLGLYLLLLLFVLSAALGGLDDLLNIYGVERSKPRPFGRILKLIKVHKNFRKRVQLFLLLPWSAYKSFFYMLGSNPGKGIQAHEKIIVQSIIGLSLGIALYFFTPSSFPEIVHIPLLNAYINIGWLLIPFAWIAVVLMSNAVNLADGMDALAASELLLAFFAFFVISFIETDSRFIFLNASVIGSLIAYIYFNIPPARFQMGDVGSLAMGTLLTVTAFMLQQPFLLLIVGFPFVITLLSTIIQGIGRRILGIRIFRMAPIHYHFQMAKEWSEEKVVMRFILFSLVCSIIGIFVYLLKL